MDNAANNAANYLKSKKLQQYQRMVSLIVAIVSIIAGVATLMTFVNSKKVDITFPDKEFREKVNRIQNTLAIESEVKSLSEFRKKLESDIKQIKDYSTDSKSTLKIARIESSVSDIDKRLKNLEEVILSNPPKALEIPMLRKDLDGYKNEYQVSVVGLKHEIERVYDFNKWFLGLMFTMFVSIFGLAFTNFIKSKNVKDE